MYTIHLNEDMAKVALPLFESQLEELNKQESNIILRRTELLGIIRNLKGEAGTMPSLQPVVARKYQKRTYKQGREEQILNVLNMATKPLTYKEIADMLHNGQFASPTEQRKAWNTSSVWMSKLFKEGKVDRIEEGNCYIYCTKCDTPTISVKSEAKRIIKSPIVARATPKVKTADLIIDFLTQTAPRYWSTREIIDKLVGLYGEGVNKGSIGSTVSLLAREKKIEKNENDITIKYGVKNAS